MSTQRMARMQMLVPALVLVPMMLSAQGTTASSTTQRAVHGQARTPQARIEAALTAAAEANIPVELVKSKVAEGEAKRVPPDRIATAVEARVKSLTRASQAMERAEVEYQNAGELAVTADALDVGVSESTVIKVARDAPPERRTVAIAVLADLVRLGNTSDHALGRVSTVLTSSTALASLHAEVASQLRLGGLTSTLEAAGIIRVP